MRISERVRGGGLFTLGLGLMIAVGHPAVGQTAPDAGAKAAFDVVSIKPSNSPDPGGSWGISRNEYRVRNTPLTPIILQAYLGDLSVSWDRLKGAPAWVRDERWEITAKADDATADSWKGLRQAKQVALAAPLLRTMLEDRCKLKVHTEPTEIQGYALVIGKNGMKMKEAEPNEPPPKRYVRFEGGWMAVYPEPGPDAKQSITYLQVTMAELTAFMGMGGTPVVDQTRLTGKYDFELPKIDTTPPENTDGVSPAARPDAAHMFDWSAAGLEMRPIKVPAKNVVVDHIERPTAN